MRLISFNPSMLTAVRAGSKTVTRRRISAVPLLHAPSRYRFLGMLGEEARFEDNRTLAALPPVQCPFGQPGEVLQVQEDSALRLQVISVRAEQVQRLTAADALAEGIRLREHNGHAQWGGVEPAATGDFQWYGSPVTAFQALLNSIYPTAWACNEWVWVVEFHVQSD